METTKGSLPGIVKNISGLYEGDLVRYFQIVFNNARNLRHPYHNFRHIFHVLYMCWQACVFYKNTLTKRQMRNVLIAALFHDFNHSGVSGDDDLNVEKAIRGLQKYALPEDIAHIDEISSLIKATQFPYVIESKDLGLPGLIIRDADMTQCFSPAWIQQVVFGLATELGARPIDILKTQPKFLLAMRFNTQWGKEMFSAEEINGKIKETEELLELLEEEPILA